MPGVIAGRAERERGAIYVGQAIRSLDFYSQERLMSYQLYALLAYGLGRETTVQRKDR